MRTNTILCASLFLLLGIIPSAAAQPASVPGALLDAALVRGTLPNGFSYYVRKSEREGDRISIRFVVRVGNTDERPNETEYAHLIEHLVGTHVPSSLSYPSIWDWTASWGGVGGTDYNAFTMADRTLYTLDLPAGRADLLPQALELARGWSDGAGFDSETIDRERNAVIEEINRGGDLGDRLADRINPLMINGDIRMFKTRGARRDAMSAPDAAGLKRFHTRWYRPDLQAIIITGAIDPAETERYIKRLFSSAARRPRLAGAKRAPVSLQRRTGFSLIPDREAKDVTFRFVMKRRAPQDHRATGAFRDGLIGRLADRMFEERLSRFKFEHGEQFAELVSGGEGIFTDRRYPGRIAAAEVSFAAPPKRAADTLVNVLSLVEGAKRRGFAETELADAKVAVFDEDTLAKWPLSERKAKAQWLANAYVDHFIDGTPTPAFSERANFYRPLIDGITLAEVNSRVARWFDADDRELIVVAESGAKAPSKKVALDIVRKVEVAIPLPYVQPPSISTLRPREVASYRGKIESKHFPASGVTRLYLPEKRITILLRPDRAATPQDAATDPIRLLAINPNGKRSYEESDLAAVSAAPVVLNSRGISGLSEFDLARLRKARELWVYYAIDDMRAEVSAGGRRADLDLMLQIATGYFGPRRAGHVELRDWTKKAIARLEETAAIDPKAELWRRSGEAIDRRPGQDAKWTAGQIDAVTAGAVERVYDHAFGDASDFIFIVSGRFDPNEITASLVNYIGALPSASADRIFAVKPGQVPLGAFREEIVAGHGDSASVILAFTGEYRAASRPGVTHRALSAILGERLNRRLRTVEQATYSVDVNGLFRINPSEQRFMVSFDCAPANVEKLIEAVRDEIAALARSGPRPEEVAASATSEANSRGGRDDSMWFWSEYFANQYIEKGGADTAYAMPPEDFASANDIQMLAQVALGPQRLKQFVLFPDRQEKE